MSLRWRRLIVYLTSPKMRSGREGGASSIGQHTDAARRSISTFGASAVSPENQHLDPVCTSDLITPALLLDEQRLVEVGLATLRWALDGRWSIRHPEDGTMQPEQLLHTRWYYNEFFTRRGDYRRGMPIGPGGMLVEHLWPQVVPSAVFLGLGGIHVLWPAQRATGLDACVIERAQFQPSRLVLHVRELAAQSRWTLLKGTGLPAEPGRWHRIQRASRRRASRRNIAPPPGTWQQACRSRSRQVPSPSFSSWRSRPRPQRAGPAGAGPLARSSRLLLGRRGRHV